MVSKFDFITIFGGIKLNFLKLKYGNLLVQKNMRKNFPSKLKIKLVIGIVNSNPHAKNQLCIFNILEATSSQILCPRYRRL